ncbi:hypothetical protein [Nonomuraea dietziae]|uniref:hypothetical protein n=1 Tax=Nonomuraea dietziae TaxID=65515 RepID=UPI001FE4A1A4|nr:hypothetical protein [Nonomuraea dietziae]
MRRACQPAATAVLASHGERGTRRAPNRSASSAAPRTGSAARLKAPETSETTASR